MVPPLQVVEAFGTGQSALWKSDGTEAGTVEVKEIWLTGTGNPAQFTEVSYDRIE